MKKLLLTLFTAVMSITAWGESFTWTASEQGYSNAEALTEVTLNATPEFKATFTANAGTAPAYYDTGTAARLYGKNTMKIDAPSGYTMTRIVLTFSSASNVGTITSDPAAYSLSSTTGTWTGTASSVTFTNTAASGHARIKSISVTYNATGGGDPDPGAGGGDPDPEPTPSVDAAALFETLTGITSAPYVFYESFNKCEGTGGNDGKWSGTIASNTPSYDNVGWTVANAGGASKCLKLGTGSKKGSAETPAIEHKGTFYLVFRAAAWGTTDGTTLNLTATNATLGVSSVTMKNSEFVDYAVLVTANTAESFKVKFEAKNASDNRFFIDEVRIVPVYEKNLSTTGYASFSAPYNVTVPDGTTAYKAAVDGDAVILTSVEGVIPANTGVILYNENKPVVLTATSEDATDDFSDNELVATSENPTVPAEGIFYALSASAAKFVKVANGLELSADKAYLPGPASAGSLRVVIEGMEDGNQTAISLTPSVAEESACYDLYGRKSNGKGLMIQNGKVVLVK